MYLKGIEIKGFKSFLDKTSITFPKGMISIVGPNGSGKSNILDAIRWVLGEQSIKSLRGDKLEDVIFSGTQKRSPSGYCEVTLIIDNEDKKVDIEYSELSIKRKAYRSGESQFFINNKKCRLKDIKEILLDTGIGKEGYSIISQGRVDEIINSSGNQKRALLEEASGITKYRYKKEEGEKNLLTATENLERIKDIYTEIENQIRPLKIQKEKAEKYLEYSKELKTQEINKFLKSHDEFEKNIEEIKTKKNRVQDIMSNEKSQLDDKNSQITKVQDELEFISDKKNELALHISEIMSNLTKNEADISIKCENIKNLEYTNEMLKNQIDESDEQLESIKKKYESLIEERKNISQEKIEISDLIISKQYGQDKYAQNIEELTANIRADEHKIRDIENDIAKLETRMDFQKSNIDSFSKKFAEYETEIQNYNKKIQDINKSIYEKDIKIENTQKSIKEITNIIEEYKISLEDYKEKTRQAFSDINENNLTIKDLSAKLHILENLENDMQGFSKGVKALLKNRNLQGIQDVTANIIKVKKGYEKAIEQLLAGRLENIIIDKASNTKEAIEYLKKENLGRATFLPLDTIKGTKMEYRDEGIKAIDVVEYEPKYENIISNLLGKMVIVDDMDTGLKISKKYSSSFRIATKQGDIFNVGGSITGGSINFSKEIFTRRSTIIENREKIAKSKEKLSELEINLKNLQEKQESIKNQINAQDIKLSEYKDIYNKVQNEKTKLNLDRSHQNELLNQLDEERKSVEYSNLMAIKSYDADKEILKQLKISLSSLNESSAKKNVSLSEASKQMNDIKTSINELEIKKQLIVQNLENIENNIEELSENIKNQDKKLSKSQEKISGNLIQIKKYEDIIKSLEDENIKFKNTNKDNKEKLEKISSSEKNIKENLKNLNQEKEQLLSKINEINTQIIKIDSEENNVNYKISLLEESLSSSYSMDFDEAKQYKDDSIIVSQSTIKNLKEKISSLGNVNLDSIQEFEKVNERFIFYKTQKEDLEESIEKINSIIKSLEKSMIQDFKTNFEIINKNFDDIFKILFGGGSGKLILEDENDLLNTDIEISVQPPGKKLRAISMLSGGEKALSAIALLFAIIAKKPVPFCILDEIDAPLDDANIYRYISYLTTLVNTTQFVTITHRRGTMEASDYIYGVTMQEKGVSDIVSLKLEDAKHYIEE